MDVNCVRILVGCGLQMLIVSIGTFSCRLVSKRMLNSKNG